MIGLTSKQRCALNFIRAHLAAHDGVAPTFSEIATALGSKSASSAHNLVRGLVERGAIRRLKNRSRAIEIIAPDALTIKPAPDVRRALDAIAEREGTKAEVVASELIRGALGLGV